MRPRELEALAPMIWPMPSPCGINQSNCIPFMSKSVTSFRIPSCLCAYLTLFQHLVTQSEEDNALLVLCGRWVDNTCLPNSRKMYVLEGSESS